MFESLAGLMTPATRQKDGRFLMGYPTGGAKDPVDTVSAVLTVAPGRASVLKLSQLAAAATMAPEAMNANRVAMA